MRSSLSDNDHSLNVYHSARTLRLVIQLKQDESLSVDFDTAVRNTLTLNPHSRDHPLPRLLLTHLITYPFE